MSEEIQKQATTDEQTKKLQEKIDELEGEYMALNTSYYEDRRKQSRRYWGQGIKAPRNRNNYQIYDFEEL
jgi:hypothetical protein